MTENIHDCSPNSKLFADMDKQTKALQKVGSALKKISNELSTYFQ